MLCIILYFIIILFVYGIFFKKKLKLERKDTFNVAKIHRKSDSLSSLLFLSLVPEISTQSTVARRIRSTPAIPRSGKGTSTTSDCRLACLGPETLSVRARFA